MPYFDELLAWPAALSSQLRSLSRPQAKVLAQSSLATTITQDCGLSTVVYFLAQCVADKEENLRQQLRELAYAKSAKRGQQRCELEDSQAFPELLGWVMRYWQDVGEPLFLALGATHLRERFTVLSVSVILRSGAIPVAWTVRGGKRSGSGS